MSSNYTQADYHRDLGITPPTSETPPASLHESIRNAPVGQRAEAMLDVVIGAVPATEAQRREAERLLTEADRHPWRAEWPRRDVYTRRGQEAELAELYESRLGETPAVAEAHVHRVLTAAWDGHRDVPQRLAAVAGMLATERARIGSTARPAREAHPASRTTTITETTRKGYTR